MFQKRSGKSHVYDVSAEKAAKEQGARFPRQNEDQVGAQRAPAPPLEGQEKAFRLSAGAEPEREEAFLMALLTAEPYFYNGGINEALLFS